MIARKLDDFAVTKLFIERLRPFRAALFHQPQLYTFSERSPTETG